MQDEVKEAAEKLSNALPNKTPPVTELEYDIAHAIETHNLPVEDAVDHVAREHTDTEILTGRVISNGTSKIRIQKLD